VSLLVGGEQRNHVGTRHGDLESDARIGQGSFGGRGAAGGFRASRPSVFADSSSARVGGRQKAVMPADNLTIAFVAIACHCWIASLALSRPYTPGNMFDETLQLDSLTTY